MSTQVLSIFDSFIESGALSEESALIASQDDWYVSFDELVGFQELIDELPEGTPIPERATELLDELSLNYDWNEGGIYSRIHSTRGWEQTLLRIIQIDEFQASLS